MRERVTPQVAIKKKDQQVEKTPAAKSAKGSEEGYSYS